MFILVENTDLVSLGDSEKSAAKKNPKVLHYSATAYLECGLPNLYRGKC